MSMPRLVVTILLAFSTNLYSDVFDTIISRDSITPIETFPRLKLVPVFPTGQANFAYVVKSSSTGEERLQMAQLTQLSPPQARIINSNMAIYDGNFESIQAQYASPDNRLLAVYSYQMGFDFFDHNVRVYRMSNGQAVTSGLINEHAFASINKDVRPSTVFEDCVDQERDFGVSEADLALLDFRLNVDDASEGYFPVIRWHDNDTLSVTIRPEVEVFYTGSEDFLVCYGREDFTVYATVTDGELHRDGFDDTQPAPASPWVYNLKPAGRDPGYLSLDNTDIGFLSYFYLNGRIYTFYLKKQAILAEGKIPRRFQVVPY